MANEECQGFYSKSDLISLAPSDWIWVGEGGIVFYDTNGWPVTIAEVASNLRVDASALQIR